MGREKDAAIVKGTSASGEAVEFKLTNFEIKHIRRCISNYNYIHPVMDEGATVDQNALYTKWKVFGNYKFRQKLKPKMFDVPEVCKIPGCTDPVTIDHIHKNSSALGSNRKENLQYLCRKHHDVKEMMTRIMWKEKELAYLQQQMLEMDPEQIVVKVLRGTDGITME